MNTSTNASANSSANASAPTFTSVVRRRAARHALLPLRLFLGLTFVYAGLDKLTDPAFLSAAGDGSIGQQMQSVRDASALPGLVDLALGDPVAFGFAMAIGELAVGLAVVVGLLTRVAALGGSLISLSLWLTVSWAATPYYHGNDLAYLMAWTPLVLTGAPVLSLDAVLLQRRRQRLAPAAGPELQGPLRIRRLQEEEVRGVRGVAAAARGVSARV
ncbi:DoxX family protein [Streptomyces sp. BR123]|nr:DoxX family protein [Streptomyces sp. BR123]